MLVQLIKLMRPWEWVKNLFVLLPALFWMASPLRTSESFSVGSVVVLTLLTFAAFSLLSSAVYCMNDAIDAAKDRTHPVKRTRPVASGAVSRTKAVVLGIFLCVIALALGLFIDKGVLLVLLLYLLLQVCYNGGAKYLILVDVVVLALGFVLRAAAGAYAIDIKLSIWLLLCVFFLCLYLGFIKRLCDYSSAHKKEVTAWKSPAGYDNPHEINWLLGVSAVLSVMMYLTYALSSHAYDIFGARAGGLAALTPLVIIVIHRFYRRGNAGSSDSPLKAIIEDRVVQIGSALYVIGVLVVLYVPLVERALMALLLSPPA